MTQEEEAAKNYSENWDEITGLDYESMTPFDCTIIDFIAGVKWQKEQMEKLKDFDTWKEWKSKID